MSLKLRITDDMKTAMREKDMPRLSTIRLLTAAMKQREVDERIELTDADIVSIVEKEIKKRRDAAQQYQAANRQDLADKEQQEATVLEAYLPPQLSDEQILSAIDAALADCGATGPAAMGKLMGILKPQLAGQADMSRVSTLIKSRLNG